MLQHCVSEGEFYIGRFCVAEIHWGGGGGGGGYVSRVTLIYLYCIRRNITLGGYLDTRRNI